MSAPKWEEYFSTTSPPVSYNESKQNIKNFCDKFIDNEHKLVLVTSGGTTVPLEHNTVRFVDNFSAGTRGSAAAEYFVEQGYGVIFLHREKSLEPFVRHFMGRDFLDKLSVTGDSSIVVNSDEKHKLVSVLNKYIHSKENGQILFISFTTLSDYLWLLRAACSYLADFGERVMLFLAAAVSDFYVPSKNLPEHKMQSASGAPKIELQLVPKMLEPLVNHWVPHAFIISFKLETDGSKLMETAQRALKKYNHHFVVGNVLQTRKTHVSVVWKDGNMDISINEAEQKAGVEIESKIVPFLVEKHNEFLVHATNTEHS